MLRSAGLSRPGRSPRSPATRSGRSIARSIEARSRLHAWEIRMAAARSASARASSSTCDGQHGDQTRAPRPVAPPAPLSRVAASGIAVDATGPGARLDGPGGTCRGRDPPARDAGSEFRDGLVGARGKLRERPDHAGDAGDDGPPSPRLDESRRGSDRGGGGGGDRRAVMIDTLPIGPAVPAPPPIRSSVVTRPDATMRNQVPAVTGTPAPLRPRTARGGARACCGSCDPQVGKRHPGPSGGPPGSSRPFGRRHPSRGPRRVPRRWNSDPDPAGRVTARA